MQKARNLKDRHLLNALGVGLFLALAGSVVFATLTRPIPREHITHKLDDLRPGLIEGHEGEGVCVRWGEPGPLTEAEIGGVLGDLGQALHTDLHTVLPLLTLVRTTNRARARDHHPLSPRDEVIEAAFGRLSALDRARFDLSGQTPDELLPMLDNFRPDDPAIANDVRRAERIRSRLDAREIEVLEGVVSRWRSRLVGRDAQVSLVDAVAERVTDERIDALVRALAHYERVFGRYPSDLGTLIGFVTRIEQLDPVLVRGMERDGTLRDGWLRPFEYYTVGPKQYRLISEGPSDNTDEDDRKAP